MNRVSRHLRRLAPWLLHLGLLCLLGTILYPLLGPANGVGLAAEPDVSAGLRAAVHDSLRLPQSKSLSLDAVTWQRNLREAAAGKAVEAAKLVEPIVIELTGAVLDGQASMAFIKDRSGTVQMTSVGQEVDGWKVLEIRERSVVIKKGDRTETLEIKPQS